MQMTFEQVVELALSVFPEAEIEMDENGEWAVYTGVKAQKEGE